jgi:hypothetical protein
MWALKTPTGDIVEATVAPTRTQAWGNAFDFLAKSEPSWELRSIRQWEASVAFARRLGYRLVRVRVVSA